MVKERVRRHLEETSTQLQVALNQHHPPPSAPELQLSVCSMPDEDSDRDLRSLINNLGIAFKVLAPNRTSLPKEHTKTFEKIRAIRDQKFEDYGANITLASDEPWKEQTKRRAMWLANRAASLVGQQRNEAGWRFSLENDVFHRFRVEVAW